MDDLVREVQFDKCDVFLYTEKLRKKIIKNLNHFMVLQRPSYICLIPMKEDPVTFFDR